MMKFYRLIILVLTLGVSTAYGQHWVEKDLDGISYNCEVVRALVEAYGDQLYVRIEETEFTVKEYHASTTPDCVESSEVSGAEAGVEASKSMVSAETSGRLFQITVDTVINLRACSSTTCDLLGRARANDLFDVVSVEGEWYEIEFEGREAFIAAWLARRLVDPPKGLLADFQFAALNPYEYFSDILHGTTQRRGTHWLNLTNADGSPAAYELQAMNWGIDATDQAYSQPRFFGWGKQDWTALPDLLPESSFYVYVVRDQEMYELPIANYSYVDDYNLGFEAFERPSGVVTGAQIRVLVADSGQADHIRDWIEAGNPLASVAPPARPAPPNLSVGDGKVMVSISPASDGPPVMSYEVGFREVGSGPSIVWTPNVSGEGDYIIERLRNGAKYEVTLVAIGRGGRSAQSRFAAIELPSVLASG